MIPKKAKLFEKNDGKGKIASGETENGDEKERLLLIDTPNERRRVLFICSHNQLRSPTAERVFRDHPNLEVKSAGVSDLSPVCVDRWLLEWAQIIFVMEPHHWQELGRRFREVCSGKKVICLNIPDQYNYMDPALVEILKEKVSRHLGEIDL